MQSHPSQTEIFGSARATILGEASDSAPSNVEWLSLRSGNVLYRQRGNGPPLILLHGWATSSRFWIGTLSQLASIRSCYALDLPGFGESPALKEPTTIARLAACVIECADKLGLQQFDLNTHSFGATVGLYIAAHWPERVKRLILTSYGLLHDANDPLYLITRAYLQMGQILWQPFLNQLHPLFKLAQPVSVALTSLPPFPQFLEALLFSNRPSTSLNIQEEVADVARMDIRAHIGCMLSSGDPVLLHAIANVQAPTLLVCGKNDRLVPNGAAAGLHARLPHSQLHMIENCGHVPVYEHAALYHQIVRTFLARKMVSEHEQKFA